MENIDIQYTKYCTLKEQISNYTTDLYSEQDTRIKVIDRLLIEILGWEYDDIITESRSGEGFIDYKVCINGISKLIVEAKKDGKKLGFDSKNSAKGYKLNGPIFKEENVKKGINQAIYYSAFNSTELCCLTNGKEWVIFRGNRLGDGTNVLDGFGFIFSDLTSIKNNFKLFFELLSKEHIKNIGYRAYFQEIEGQPLRTKVFSRQIRYPNDLKAVKRGDYSNDFDKTMNLFFQQLSGDDDKDLLVNCFVHTKESEIADDKLTRIAEDLASSVKSLDTFESSELLQVIERIKSTHRHELVLIVGGKGAGKTTFIERFFNIILNNEVREDCIVINVNLAKSQGNENTIIDWLNNQLINIIENQVYNGSPTFDELQGMFFGEYKRLSEGAYKYLYESNKNAFKIEFGKIIEDKRLNQPDEYIKKLINNIVKSRKKIPCLVFDNTDHFSIEFQEKVFQYAMSIYESELCLILLPITDKTSWQLNKQGALQSFDDIEILYLPTPSPKKVIQKRIEYLTKKIELSKKEEKGNYLSSRGIRLSIDNVEKFVYYLQKLFLNDKKTAIWIGNFSNLDIRRCLAITRDLIASPYLKIDDFLKLYVSADVSPIKESQINTAMIKGKYNFYPIGQHNFIQNIFEPHIAFETTPLLTLRILQLLNDKRGKAVDEDSFININQIQEYFLALGIEHNVTIEVLDNMLKKGLCYSYDPTIRDISLASKIEISPSGRQHYEWGIYNPNYLCNMLDVTPVRDEVIFKEFEQNVEKLRETSQHKYFAKLVEVFKNYLVNEDSLYCIASNHEAYKGQNKLIEKFYIKN